jgi:hypothetical protein
MNNVLLVLDTNGGSVHLSFGDSYVNEDGVLVLRVFIKEDDNV